VHKLLLATAVLFLATKPVSEESAITAINHMHKTESKAETLTVTLHVSAAARLIHCYCHAMTASSKQLNSLNRAGKHRVLGKF